MNDIKFIYWQVLHRICMKPNIFSNAVRECSLTNNKVLHSSWQQQRLGGPSHVSVSPLQSSPDLVVQKDGIRVWQMPKKPHTHTEPSKQWQIKWLYAAVTGSSSRQCLVLWSLGPECLPVNNGRKWGQELCSTHWEPIKTQTRSCTSSCAHTCRLT